MVSKFDSSNLYTCEICAKSFQSKQSFSNHKETHKEVPSPCDICTKVFKSSRNLKQHKSTVHTENIFNCNECPKKFSTTANLRDHVKKTHEKAY